VSLFVGHVPVLRHGHRHRAGSHLTQRRHVITAVADPGETVSREDAVHVAAGETA